MKGCTYRERSGGIPANRVEEQGTIYSNQVSMIFVVAVLDHRVSNYACNFVKICLFQHKSPTPPSIPGMSD